MDTSHTTIEIPRSPAPARRITPRNSPNVLRKRDPIPESHNRTKPPTNATNVINISEHDHATPVLPHGRNRRDIAAVHNEDDGRTERLQPLLETDATNPLAPVTGPEIDDLDENSGSIPLQPQSGIDDGLLEPTNPDSGIGEDQPDITTEKVNPTPDGEYDPNKDPEAGPDDPSVPDDGNYGTKPLMTHGVDIIDYGERHFAFPNSLSPRIGGDDTFPIDDAPAATPRVIPDVNVYQQKKNLAQGMMDLALLSANANQLRYVWESYGTHPYFYPSVVFILMSLILQIGVGVGLIWLHRFDIKNCDDICKADRINNLTVIGIFIITVVNVFIASFGVGSGTTSPA